MSVPWWIGATASVVIAGIAWRTRHLSRSGALAAIGVGTVVLHAALSWGVVLVAWFMATSLLSRFGRDRKWARTAHMLAKNDQRDAWQVLANGGVFAVLAVSASVVRAVATGDGGGGPTGVLGDVVNGGTAATSVRLAVAAAGALAAAAADTFATEIGTLSGSAPRSVRHWQPVATGTSGAITAAGMLASAFGALFVAFCASLVGMTPTAAIPAIAMGGFLGALVDTLLGAWVQERRWCPQCEAITERVHHDCGASTTPHAGMAWINNDMVNILCTVSGAIIAVCAWH